MVKVIADKAKKMKQWGEICFLDDHLVGGKILGIMVQDKMNTLFSIDYDTEIGDYVNLSLRVNLAGNIKVGQCA